MSLDLRPLSIGELFDRAFVLYRRHFWLFVGITAVPGVFALAFSVLQSGVQNPAIGSMDPESPEFATAMAMVWWAVGGAMAVLAVYLVIYMVALGATTFAVSELYLGRTASIAQVYGRMKGRVWALLWLLALVVLRLIGLWLLAFALVGMSAVISPILGVAVMLLAIFAGAILSCLVMLRYGLSVPALVLEGRSARASLKRSVQLTRGRLGRVFLLVACASVVSYAALAILQFPFVGMAMYVGLETTTGFWLNVLGAVLGTLGTTLTGPFLIIGLALIYYDARIREEGFDLEVMLNALEGTVEPARV